MSSIKKRPSTGDGNKSSSKTNKKNADASPIQLERFGENDNVVRDVDNVEVLVGDGNEQEIFGDPNVISRTPILDAFYFSSNTQKEVERIAKYDEHAGTRINQFAYPQMVQGGELEFNHPDGLLDKFTKPTMQKVKDCARYRWTVTQMKKLSEREAHDKGTVVFHGIWEGRKQDLSAPPTEITADMLSKISKTSLDLVDSCGQVNGENVLVQTQAYLEERGINRMEMELLAEAVGLYENTWDAVETRLDQIECKQTRTIEYARLAAIYKTMAMSILDRIDALNQAQAMSTRVSGLLEKIPDEVADRLNEFVAVNDTTLEAFNEARADVRGLLLTAVKKRVVATPKAKPPRGEGVKLSISSVVKDGGVGAGAQDDDDEDRRPVKKTTTSILAIQPGVDGGQLKDLKDTKHVKAWCEMVENPNVEDAGPFITRGVGMRLTLASTQHPDLENWEISAREKKDWFVRVIRELYVVPEAERVAVSADQVFANCHFKWPQTEPACLDVAIKISEQADRFNEIIEEMSEDPTGQKRLRAIICNVFEKPPKGTQDSEDEQAQRKIVLSRIKAKNLAPDTTVKKYTEVFLAEWTAIKQHIVLNNQLQPSKHKGGGDGGGGAGGGAGPSPGSSKHQGKPRGSGGGAGGGPGPKSDSSWRQGGATTSQGQGGGATQHQGKPQSHNGTGGATMSHQQKAEQTAQKTNVWLRKLYSTLTPAQREDVDKEDPDLAWKVSRLGPKTKTYASAAKGSNKYGPGSSPGSQTNSQGGWQQADKKKKKGSGRDNVSYNPLPTDNVPYNTLLTEPTLTATIHSNVNTSLPSVNTTVLLDTGAQVNTVGESTPEGALARAKGQIRGRTMTICSPLAGTCTECDSSRLTVCICNEKGGIEGLTEDFYILPKSKDPPIIGYPTVLERDLIGKNPSLFHPSAPTSATAGQKYPGDRASKTHPQNASVASVTELYASLSREEKAMFRKHRRRNLRKVRVRQLRKEVDHALECREVDELQYRAVGSGGLPGVWQISRPPTSKTAGRRGDRHQLPFRAGGDRLGRWIPGGVKRRLRSLQRELITLETKLHPTSGVDNTSGKADQNTTNPRTTPPMNGVVCNRDELLTGLDNPTLAAQAEEEWMDKRELHLSEEGSPEELIEFHGSPRLLKLLQRVCSDLKGVFRASVSDVPASFRESFEVEVDQGAWMKTVSGKERMRTQSPEKQAEIERQVQELLKCKVIEKCNEARYSHVVLARKPNGKWRFCIDYRQLNLCSGSLGWPIPKIKEILLRLGDKKAKFFGVIDMTAGYHQADLHPDSRKFTTFRTHSGTYQWTRVPFGLKGAPSYYQAQMAHALEGLLYGVCELYLDDIIIHGQTEEEFATNLRDVLTRLQERGITVNPAKCRLGVPEVEYVGHVISETGLTMSDSKKQKVLDFPLPETTKQLRGFLGLVNYFRDHIRGHAVICHPLHQLVAQTSGKRLQWTPVCTSAFQEIKAAVAELQKLFFPVEEAPVFLHTDACKYGVGAYVFQVIDGVERPIGFYSKSLKGAELNWSTIEQECYAIMCAVREFDYLLRYRKFLLRTDHHNLIEMNVSKAPKVMRWKMELLEYDFNIEHIAGEDNIVADGLSRFVADLGKDPAVGAKRSSEGEALPPTPMLARLRIGYGTVDDRVVAVSRALARLHIPPEQLTLSPGIRDTIAKYHNSVSGHHGIDSTLSSMRGNHEDWKHMARDVKRFIRQCPTCQKNRTIPFNGVTEAYTLSTYEGPLRHLSMDVVGPFPADVDGNQYVLVIIDRFSRFVTLWAMKDQTAASAASKVLMHAGTFGTPDTIGTDGGPCFISQVLEELLALADIKHLNITPYSHQENGMVERSIRTLQEHLRAFLFDKEIKSKWSIILPLIQRIMNSSVHSAIQCCPAQLVFTDAIDLDRHIIHEPLARDTVALPEWHKVVVEAQAYLIVAVQKLLKDVDEAHRMKRQRPGQISTYPVGSYVLVQHLTGLGRPPTKTHMLWLGPYRVVKVSSGQVTVQDVIHGRTRAINIKATRPFNMDPDHVDPVEIRRRDTDEFMVERIVDHIDETPPNVKNGPRKNSLLFKVRWLGYGEKHDTWEPWVSLCNNICLHRYLHNNGLDRLIPKDQRRVDYEIGLEDLVPPQWE